MNRYMIYKELQELLEMCKKAGFDLYEMCQDNYGKHILSDMSDIVKAFRERADLNLWISQEGPCTIANKDEIRVKVTRNRIYCRLIRRFKSKEPSPPLCGDGEFNKEEIPGILKKWAEENENE